MASPGAIASSLKHHCWNPRKSDFFPSFDAEIELDRDVLRPFKPITGRLKLATSRLIRFHGGIRVQLDGIVRLRFQSKVDNRLSTHWAVESIFKDAPQPDEGNYIKSPVMEQVLGSEDDVNQACNMEPGQYCYPFTLPGTRLESLPAPFRSQIGTLQFHVVAYMGAPFCYVQVAEHPVHFGGFLDLGEVPEALQPLSVSSFLHKSIFSCKPLATFTLTSPKTGYHPGDTIPFTLAIDNPKIKLVKSVRVTLVRKSSYTAQGATKTTIVELDAFDGLHDSAADEEEEGNQSPTRNADEMMFMGSLNIPKPCIPTYTGKPIYSVNYYIQYEVKVADHSAVGKGQAHVVIGSTKPSAVMLVNRLQCRRESVSALKEEALINEGKARPRSQSICFKSGLHPVSMNLREHSPPVRHAGPRRTLSMMSVRDFGESLVN